MADSYHASVHTMLEESREAGESTAFQILYATLASQARLDNSAIAWTQSCRGCIGASLSVQVVVLPAWSAVRPNNRALAVTA